ncbi:hypothetical protein PInf_004928 [Phytophthora infestans]|nr:hypothetical protein PInf_004928 [Phytophthora infestans]
MFVPSPPGPLHSTDEDGDEEDPGDGISDGRTLEGWAEYLKEVFRDEEIDLRYAAAQYSVPRNCIDDDNEFEAIPTAVLREFPDENDPDFPQEELRGFRAQKATLENLFAPQTSE